MFPNLWYPDGVEICDVLKWWRSNPAPSARNTKTSYAWGDIHYLKWLAGFCPYYKIQACSKRPRLVSSCAKKNGRLEFCLAVSPVATRNLEDISWNKTSKVKRLYKFCVFKFLFDKSLGSSSACRAMRPCNAPEGGTIERMVCWALRISACAISLAWMASLW